MSPSDTLTARCYCGRSHLHFCQAPLTVAYCHCSDCRRWTGGPVGAFAAFASTAIDADPNLGPGTSFAEGVRRWTCPSCGSPMMAEFDYLPGQTYVPIGIIDQADKLPPSVHCHEGSRLSWLHIDDEAPRIDGTARTHLNDP